MFCPEAPDRVPRLARFGSPRHRWSGSRSTPKRRSARRSDVESLPRKAVFPSGRERRRRRGGSVWRVRSGWARRFFPPPPRHDFSPEYSRGGRGATPLPATLALHAPTLPRLFLRALVSPRRAVRGCRSAPTRPSLTQPRRRFPAASPTLRPSRSSAARRSRLLRSRRAPPAPGSCARPRTRAGRSRATP